MCLVFVPGSWDKASKHRTVQGTGISLLFTVGPQTTSVYSNKMTHGEPLDSFRRGAGSAIRTSHAIRVEALSLTSGEGQEAQDCIQSCAKDSENHASTMKPQ